MLKSIWIISNYNQYESKRYFAHHFGVAMRRKGIDAQVFENADGQWFDALHKAGTKRPDLVCSFHRTTPLPNGQFWWEASKQPYLTMWVDPAIQFTDIFKSKTGYVSYVDRFDCEFMHENHFDRAFFLPHAVERELCAETDQKRPYDVVFLGTSYDPESLRDHWRKNMEPDLVKAVEAACEITLSKMEVPYWRALKMAAKELQFDLSKVHFPGLTTYVDIYTRGIDRIRLIQGIKTAKVHIFGGTSQRDNTRVRGWAQILGPLPNVIYHPAIPYKDSLEILKQSKICLNSNPFFKNGTHERIFAALACGALPLTMDNLWVRENFEDEKDLLTYQPGKWNEVEGRINEYLGDPQKLKEVVESGREKVMKFHTWDNRVDELSEALKNCF